MEINDDLLISYLLGEATIEQINLIDEWRRANLDNQQRLDQFSIIWEKSCALAFKGNIDTAASLRRFKEKARAQRDMPKKVSAINSAYLWIKIAAVLFLVAGFAWLYSSMFVIKEIRFATQKDVVADTLSDGSVVTLNKNSMLLYPARFKSGQRQVSLTKGEAFFNVTADKTRPFIINLGTTFIRVVGTSFNVKNKNGLIEVIVESGIVQVTRKGTMVAIKKGEKVEVKQNIPALVVKKTPDHLYAYYREKKFVADDTPLWRMVEVLNEAYESHIVIGRKEISNLPLNTTFENESLDDILKVICSTFHIEMERKDNRIMLY